MPSRRGHSNSHHGCAQCKARRVKCDQTQPACTRCVKAGRECTYKHLLSAYNPFEDQNGPSKITATSQSPSPPRVHSPARSRTRPTTPLVARSNSIMTLAPTQTTLLSSIPSTPGFPVPLDPSSHHLLHHYATHLSVLLSRRDTPAPPSHVDVFPTFAAAITRHALAQPCVHHALLTFSALHVATLTGTSPSQQQSQSSRDSLVAALTHHSSALTSLLPLIPQLTTATCEPALTTSTLLVMCAFAQPLAAGCVPNDPVGVLAQISGLFRGTVALFRRGWGRDDDRPLDSATALVLRRKLLVLMASETVWPEAQVAVGEVTRMIWKLPEGPRKKALMDGAEKLGIAHQRVAAAGGRSYHVAVMWLGMMDPGFAALMKARDPLALVLLAHWVVVLKDMPERYWWIKGWARWTVEAVVRELGGRYYELLGWVKREVGISDASWTECIEII